MKLEINKMLAASEHGSLCHRLFVWLILFDPEDGGITYLRNVGELLPNYAALHPRR
jgi:hypothetical protein